ncbi:MAG: fluoride efflux transporter CrcB [Legionella sp.]
MIAPYLLVAFGGSLGAVFRYIIVVFAQSTLGLRFPYATLIVNISGSFLAGFFLTYFVSRCSGDEYWRLLFFTGFLGAYTTFSSFAVETLRLYQQEQWLKLCFNILANNIGSLVMVLLGCLLARYLISGTFYQT